VLSVIVRQTLGWSVGGNPRVRKERDWITQSQFKQKAGLGSEAVSRAIDGLVKRGIIQVLDERDQPLLTPAARRACRGRLYFRLARPTSEEPADSAAVRYPNTSLRKANSAPTFSGSETEVRKADTTKREIYKREIHKTLRRITSSGEGIKAQGGARCRRAEGAGYGRDDG
jgi:hypothetical protein